MRIHAHGAHFCQMAISKFLNCRGLANWAWRTTALLRYPAKFDPFLSLDCAPTAPTLHHATIQGKEGIKFCHLATLAHTYEWRIPPQKAQWGLAAFFARQRESIHQSSFNPPPPLLFLPTPQFPSVWADLKFWRDRAIPSGAGPSPWNRPISKVKGLIVLMTFHHYFAGKQPPFQWLGS